MEADRHDHGVPSWVDIGTDIPKGMAFYSGLFGWQYDESDPAAGGYSTARLRGRPVSGIGPQQGEGTYWTTYVNVDNADDVAKAVTAAGGTVVVEPMDVMEHGRMAIFMDDNGAAFGVWQPGQHKGAEIFNEPNTYCWSELMTDDVDKAKAFYGAVFGWGAKTNGEGDTAYTEWQVGGRSVGGLMKKPMPMMPNAWGVYFAVEKLDAGVAKVRELGGNVMIERRETPAGDFALCIDPMGAFFQIIELSEARLAGN